MLTDDAATIDHWEPWQRDYHFGVLLIYPPEPLRSQVNGLRSQYDPRSQAICDAHISLTVPLPGPISAEQWAELAAIAATVPTFPIRYGPLMNYLPYPGVCLAIEPQEPLKQLLLALEGASVFRNAAPRRYPFSAHMTIAEFISVKRTEELMVELAEVAPQGDFTCGQVAYAVPDRNFHFTERQCLTLADEKETYTRKQP